MSKIVTHPYDVVDYLRTVDDRAAYLDACLDEAKGDDGFVARALGDIVRAQGADEVAFKVGLSPAALQIALSGQHPLDLDFILRLLRALGLHLHVRPNHGEEPPHEA
jgi:probable addiction module antidote protein